MYLNPGEHYEGMYLPEIESQDDASSYFIRSYDGYMLEVDLSSFQEKGKNSPA